MKSSQLTITNTFVTSSQFNNFVDEIAAIKNRNQIDSDEIHDQLKELNNKIKEIVSDVVIASKKNDNTKILQENCSKLEIFSSKANEKFTKIANDQENVIEIIKNFRENLQSLKVEKVNFTELEELLSSKADYDVVRQKVSVEDLDDSKKEMLKSLMEITAKITECDREWKKTVENIRNLLESKQDKKESDVTFDEIIKKVNGIFDRLSTLNLLKNENEAAGTKYRLLKGVKCISCNSNSSMRVVDAHFIERHSEPVVVNVKLRTQSAGKKPTSAAVSSHPAASKLPDLF